MEDKSSASQSLDPRRRERINRYKKIIVITNFTILAIAVIGCIILLIVVSKLNNRINDLEEASRQEISKEKESGNIEPKEDSEQTSTAETIDLQNRAIQYDESQYEKVCYLTFDDGPSIYTEQILDILDEYGIKATFFVNGKTDDDSIKRYQEIVKRDSTLAMHSYSHVFSQVYSSLDEFVQDTEKLRKLLKDKVGIDTNIYRFPGGSSTTTTDKIEEYIQYLDENGYIYFDWNVSSGDATKEKLTVDEIYNNVISGTMQHSNAVVLMHDSAKRDTTVEALPMIIQKLTQEGYVFLPITTSSTVVHHNVN